MLTLSGRLIAGVIAAGLLSVLIIAAMLRASPSGHGTHTQLGLPPCGWVLALGKPCPTCGMTTAFTHMAQGRPMASLAANPAGALLSVSFAMGFWIALHAALTGARTGEWLNRLLSARVLWGAAAIWACSWGYMIWSWPG